jgi:hypothetical protein
LELIASSRAKEVELMEKQVEMKRLGEDHMIMIADLTADIGMPTRHVE